MHMGIMYYCKYGTIEAFENEITHNEKHLPQLNFLPFYLTCRELCEDEIWNTIRGNNFESFSEGMSLL